jgi:hypothetical protein
MKNLYRLSICWLSIVMVGSSACSAPETTAAPSTTASLTTVHGVVDQQLVNPQGDVDGLLLRDGAIVRLPPGALGFNGVAPGDAVDVQGDLSNGGPVPIVERASVSRNGTVITAAVPPPPPARRRGPAADAALRPMTTAGTVHALLFNREGEEDGIVLDDGTTARVPPRAGLAGLHLKVGDHVTLTGRGTQVGSAKGMRVETVALANGASVVVDTPPPVPTSVSRDGTVERVFVNPHGDVDLIMLSDGGTVRIPPTPSTVAAKLGKGQSVHIEGDAVGAAVHASLVRLPSGEIVASEPSVPPPPPPPAALPRIEDSSTIVRLLQAPRGEVDGLILADGAIVRLPRRLAEDVGDAMMVGARVHVEGEGGRYPLGTSLRADTVRLDSGQTFVDPGPLGQRRPLAAPLPPPPPAQ